MVNKQQGYDTQFDFAEESGKVQPSPAVAPIATRQPRRPARDWLDWIRDLVVVAVLLLIGTIALVWVLLATLQIMYGPGFERLPLRLR